MADTKKNEVKGLSLADSLISAYKSFELNGSIANGSKLQHVKNNVNNLFKKEEVLTENLNTLPQRIAIFDLVISKTEDGNSWAICYENDLNYMSAKGNRHNLALIVREDFHEAVMEMIKWLNANKFL